MIHEYFVDMFVSQSGFSDYVIRPASKFSQNDLFYFSDERKPGSKSYYLKIFRNRRDQFIEDSPHRKAKRELEVAQLIREMTGVYTPSSVYLGTNEDGDTAIVQEEIIGTALDLLMRQPEMMDRKDLRDIVYQAGTNLAAIHTLRSASFGDSLLDSRDRFLSWRNCFTADARKRLSKGVELGILNQKHVDFFEEILTQPILDDNGSVPTLCHNDFGPKNIIVDTDTNTVKGIIDFEEARYWIPEWDLTKANAALEYPSSNLDLRDKFLEGYIARHGENIARIMGQIRYYKPFESLYYWVWGWKYEIYKEHIVKDISRVTRID